MVVKLRCFPKSSILNKISTNHEQLLTVGELIVEDPEIIYSEEYSGPE